MKPSPDRLYELLPVVYRQRDAEQGWPLKALLQVIAEQVNVVEADIGQLYEDWFIETCQDWLVPYIGDLIGYRPVHEAGEPGEVTTSRGQQRHKILIPRREVANTIAYRRRKGTLALLELLANDVAGWPARAVEFYKLLGLAQALNHLRLERGRTADLRQGEALGRLDGPFDELAHTVDLRRINSHRTPGRYNIPSIGLFVWRLKAYPVTQAPAFCFDRRSNYYTFSMLGNNAPLYTPPQSEAKPTDIAGHLNVPGPITRRAFENHLRDYYGPDDKSLQIWTGYVCGEDADQICQKAIPPEQIIAADLSDWNRYRPRVGQVAVDPELGRIIFPRDLIEEGIWVSYHYGFSADIGGGEYERHLRQPATYQVNKQHLIRWPNQRDEEIVPLERNENPLNKVLAQWKEDNPPEAVIEITDNEDYPEPIAIELGEHQSLELRAANGTRPIIRLLNYRLNLQDTFEVKGQAGSRLVLDGLLISGRPVEVSGPLSRLAIRHCTLVPGWTIDHECTAEDGDEPSLVLENTPSLVVTIEHSILSTILVDQDEVTTDPISIRLSDSILDATKIELEAVSGLNSTLAHARLTIERSTIFGQVLTHAIDLADDSIFEGLVRVARSQVGCMRFCYVDHNLPRARTPRRYNCQPDLVEQVIRAQYSPGPERERALASERLRVRPQFNSTHYGTPTYCQLAESCAEEIKRGASDESEMGAFHDLYQPQRAANLQARLEEYTPAGMDAGIIYAS